VQRTIKSRQRTSQAISYPVLVRLAILIFLLTLTIPSHAQWEIEDSHTTASLRGIDSVGNGVAWASGTNGTILRTEDGGYVWQLCAIPPGAEKLDFRGIQAFDANIAIVMSSGKGDLSRLYKTTDGCQTWKLVFTNPDKDGFWDAVRFESPNPKLREHTRRGILIGDPVQGHFAIFTSSDLGDLWTKVTKKDVKGPPHANGAEALFAASNSCADAVGDANNLAFVTGGPGGSRLLHLEGGGLVLDEWMALPSFEETTLHFPHATDSQGAFSLAHHQIDQVTFDFMIVGGDYLKPDAPGVSVFLPAPTYSFFGRHQTSLYPTNPPHGYRSAVAYDAQQKLWITVGPNGTDISRDDGRNWAALKPTKENSPDADKNWNALSLPFVVGPNGRIGKLHPSALNP
jgi:Uncharacterized protein related to plant photosystem II stability/assembly factor